MSNTKLSSAHMIKAAISAGALKRALTNRRLRLMADPSWRTDPEKQLRQFQRIFARQMNRTVDATGEMRLPRTTVNGKEVIDKSAILRKKVVEHGTKENGPWVWRSDNGYNLGLDAANQQKPWATEVGSFWHDKAESLIRTRNSQAIPSKREPADIWRKKVLADVLSKSPEELNKLNTTPRALARLAIKHTESGGVAPPGAPTTRLRHGLNTFRTSSPPGFSAFTYPGHDSVRGLYDGTDWAPIAGEYMTLRSNSRVPFDRLGAKLRRKYYAQAPFNMNMSKYTGPDAPRPFNKWISRQLLTRAAAKDSQNTIRRLFGKANTSEPGSTLKTLVGDAASKTQSSYVP